MKPEVPNQISLWENRYEEHVEKQLHNPFSEWSKGRPKKSVTSPNGECSRSPRIYISRSPSPFEEPDATFSPLPCYHVPFNPLDHCPKPYNPSDFIQVSPRRHPPTYNNPPQSPDVNFLSRVMKWRKPDAEIEDLVPLTQIPEPAKPPEPIKVNIPIPPVYEDPVSTSPFSPPGFSLINRAGPVPCSSPRVEKTETGNWSGQRETGNWSGQRETGNWSGQRETGNWSGQRETGNWSGQPEIGNWSGQPEIGNLTGQPEIGNWSGQPENKNVSFSPASGFTPYEEEEAVPQWKPMGKTFADVIGQNKKIEEDNTDQSQEDMNYRRENLSSQINRWQQRTEDHEQKQLLNPFSGWDGASHREKLSKTDAEYGKPSEGSMTELRGKKAGDHISNEIAELCRVITDFGDRQPDKSVLIKFGNLFQVYTSISNKLVGMLMRARKQDLVHFEGEMLYQGRDNDVVIKLLQAAERQSTESAAVGIKSGNRNEAAGFGGAPAEFKRSVSGKEASSAGYSTGEMMSKSESANSASSVMKKGSSICSSSVMNEGSSMSMKDESLGSSKMMESSSNSSQVMSKEDGEFNTKMFAGSSNTSKMMAREESSSSTKMLSESSSSTKMLKEESSLSNQMLGGAVGDSGAKMLAGVSISPASLMDSLKAAEMKKKMVPGEGNTSQQIMPCDLGAVSNMASSTQQASSSSSSSMMSSKQMSSTSEQMSMATTEQMTSAMENLSMSSAESNQMNMSSAKMISANEQMSMSNKQMSMASEQMSASNKQMSSATEQMSMSNQQMSSATEQMSMSNQQMSSATDLMSMSNQQMSSATEQMSMSNQQMSSSSQSSNDLMSNMLDDSFGNMISTQGMTTSGSIQKTSQQSASSKLLSKKFSSFESSGMSLMDDTDSFMSSDIQDLKKLT